LTALTAVSSTFPGSICSLYFMWMSDVAMKVWMRPFSPACWSASHARSISLKLARQRPAISGPLMVCATFFTASKSPSEAMGNPASITSMLSFCSCLAILSFSSMFMLAPGDCSPSLRVVSKILIVCACDMENLRCSTLK